MRSQVLRATASDSCLPPSYYRSISQHLQTAFESGLYLKDQSGTEAPAGPPNPLTDPAAMDGMMAGMKTQMVMMVPQMVIMGWINFFFQGFVLSELLDPCLYLNSTGCPYGSPSSQTPVPAHARLQVNVTAWDRNKGYGRALGVLPFLVLS